MPGLQDASHYLHGPHSVTRYAMTLARQEREDHSYGVYQVTRKRSVLVRADEKSRAVTVTVKASG